MLIDEILESPDHAIAETEETADKDDFLNAYVIRAQNVADYYAENLGQKQTRMLSDFPNIAPTMPVMWFEWVSRPVEIMDVKTGAIRPGRTKLGMLCRATDLSTESPGEVAAVSRYFGDCGIPIGPETRWGVMAMAFFRLLEPGKLPHLIGRVSWRVGPNGDLLPSGPGETFNCHLKHRGTKEQDDHLCTAIVSAAEICWLSLSLMHCRNVRIEKSPPIPERLRQARERKGKHPLFRFHTVAIESSKVVAASSSSIGVPIHGQALHICRGHFKHFENNGLFGRHRGTYWWGMHRRGSSDNGTVIKDYEVKP